MNISQADIDRIVREVVAQFQRQEPATEPATDPSGSIPSVSIPVATVPTAEVSEFRLDSQVITADQVEGRLEGIRKLVVGSRAVLTPSTLEYLTDHKVAVTYRDTTVRTIVASGAKLYLIAALAPVDPASLATRLIKVGIDVQASTSRCLIETTDRLAAAMVDADQFAVVVTRYRSAALGLLNRKSNLRAVAAESFDQVEAEASQIGANTLVIDPIGKSQYQLDRMIETFVRSDCHTIPETLVSFLNKS
jgi:hypothetical protein